MSWVKRVAGVFLGGVVPPGSRGKGATAPRGRRVAVEALEDRRLLSVGGTVDFGDLPDNYGTTVLVDGARHEATGPTLGASRDAEADGIPTPGADGDDTNGSADEDGVTFGTVQMGQLDAMATVNVQNALGRSWMLGSTSTRTDRSAGPGSRLRIRSALLKGTT